MPKQFDLIVIGTGSAASTVAMHCRKKDWTVAIVDSRPFGGTCALRGCDPKKVLVGAAEIFDAARRMQSSGLKASRLEIDWPALMRFKRSFTDNVPEKREREFSNAGIATFHGRARFSDSNTVQVADEELTGKKIVIATGDAPANLEFPGTDYLLTSDQFLDLPELPRSIVLVGGGYIAFEFAHLAALAGSKVTLLHNESRPLDRFDPDLVDLLVARTRDLGVDVHLETKAVAVEKHAAKFTVRGLHGNAEVEFQADAAVHAAGRVPEIKDLNLNAGGIQWDSQGVKVNEFLQSVSNPAVFAAGDVAASGGPPLSPVASYEGRLVASNLLEGNHLKTNYAGVPSVVFTIPPLSAVGLSEHAAREQGLKVRVKLENTSNLYSSRRIKEPCSGYKIIVDEETDRILGAHLLGSQAAEVINLFAVAIRSGISATDLKHSLLAYPTGGSDVPRMLRVE